MVRRGTSFQITDQHHHQFYMEIPNPPTPRPLPSEEAKQILSRDHLTASFHLQINDFFFFLRPSCSVIVSDSNVGDPDHSVFLDPEKAGLWNGYCRYVDRLFRDATGRDVF